MSIVNCNSFSKITTEIVNDGIMFNDNILVQENKKYFDGLLDLYDYQNKMITFSLFIDTLKYLLQLASMILIMYLTNVKCRFFSH